MTTTENQIELDLIDKLQDLKYSYRSDRSATCQSWSHEPVRRLIVEWRKEQFEVSSGGLDWSRFILKVYLARESYMVCFSIATR